MSVVQYVCMTSITVFYTSPLPCSGGHGPPSGPWPWAVINAASQYLSIHTTAHILFILINNNLCIFFNILVIYFYCLSLFIYILNFVLKVCKK